MLNSSSCISKSSRPRRPLGSLKPRNFAGIESTSEVKGEDDENRSGMGVDVNFYVAVVVVVGDNNCNATRTVDNYLLISIVDFIRDHSTRLDECLSKFESHHYDHKHASVDVQPFDQRLASACHCHLHSLVH